MKKTVVVIYVFITSLTLMCLSTPSFALSTSFSTISTDYREYTSLTGPDPPFTVNWNDPTAMADNALGYIANKLFDISSYYGPGISHWDNYVIFDAQHIYSQASAVGTLATSGDVWNWYDPQQAVDVWLWAAIYELQGDPGTKVNLTLDYVYDYTYFNLALAGLSKSVTDVTYGAYIIPAAKTAEYNQDAADNWFFGDSGFPIDATFMKTYNFSFYEMYDVIGGFHEESGQQTGSLNLGSMNVGDRLFLWGGIDAWTECENYFAGLTVATMFPTFVGTVNIHEVPEPVPEPSSLLLLGTGLGALGLIAYRRKRK